MSEQAEKFYSEWYTNESAERTEEPKREFIITLDLENADIEGSIPIANTEHVVRCKDCAYVCNHECANGTRWQTCSYFDSEYAEVEPDGFCAWGERREE